MPKTMEWLKQEGEYIGASIYHEVLKNPKFKELTYVELVLLIDHMYAGMFAKLYKDTYGDKAVRG